MLSTVPADMKLFWKTSKQLLNLGKPATIIPTLNLNYEYAESDNVKATMLNTYFASQSAVVDENRPMSLTLSVEHCLQTIIISSQEVKNVLLNFQCKQTCCLDLISPRLLKEGTVSLASPISVVFNRSLVQGHFPSSWKHGNLAIIHKEDDVITIVQFSS